MGAQQSAQGWKMGHVRSRSDDVGNARATKSASTPPERSANKDTDDDGGGPLDASATQGAKKEACDAAERPRRTSPIPIVCAHRRSLAVPPRAVPLVVPPACEHVCMGRGRHLPPPPHCPCRRCERPTAAKPDCWGRAERGGSPRPRHCVALMPRHALDAGGMDAQSPITPTPLDNDGSVDAHREGDYRVSGEGTVNAATGANDGPFGSITPPPRLSTLPRSFLFASSPLRVVFPALCASPTMPPVADRIDAGSPRPKSLLNDSDASTVALCARKGLCRAEIITSALECVSTDGRVDLFRLARVESDLDALVVERALSHLAIKMVRDGHEPGCARRPAHALVVDGVRPAQGGARSLVLVRDFCRALWRVPPPGGVLDDDETSFECDDSRLLRLATAAARHPLFSLALSTKRAAGGARTRRMSLPDLFSTDDANRVMDRLRTRDHDKHRDDAILDWRDMWFYRLVEALATQTDPWTRETLTQTRALTHALLRILDDRARDVSLDAAAASSLADATVPAANGRAPAVAARDSVRQPSWRRPPGRLERGTHADVALARLETLASLVERTRSTSHFSLSRAQSP